MDTGRRIGPRRRLARRLPVTLVALLGTIAASLLLTTRPAAAAVGVAADSNFPDSVTVGQTEAPASITITNQSTGAQAIGNVALTAVTLVPSCGSFSFDCPSAAADPGVFGLDSQPVGAGGTACAGITFTYSVIDATTGKVQLIPSSPVALGPPGSATASCRIDFTFSVLRRPTIDATPGTPGLQTAAIVTASGSQGGVTATGLRSETIVVNAASPTISTTASAPVALGGQVRDTAVLTGGFNLTGTLTFTLFGPNNALCTGAPVFTSTVPVNGNGSYQSGLFTPTAVGTYRWVAAYSGDVNNASATSLCNAPNESVVVRKRFAPADFDGNGTTDRTVYRPSTGVWFVNGGGTTYHGAPGDIPVVADFNGNGTADLTVYRPSTQIWFVAGMAPVYWGAPDDVPVPGDYNGDGSADIAVYRPSTGVWYVRNGAATYWGAPGDIAVPGDYDGDGTTDLAVYRPATQTWFVRGSGGVNTTMYWGADGDVPVPGDYDGDGRIDIAVYRPSTGVWFVHGSGGLDTAVYWGAPGDIPQPGDYDGDGRTDRAVYRPSSGFWFVNGSGGVNSTTYWGAPGDVPVVLPASIRPVGPAP